MQFNPDKIPYRFLSLADRKRVVFARYGSLDNFNHIVSSLPEISKKLRIPISTLHKLLTTLHERGYQLDAFGRKYKRFKALPDAVQRILLSEDLLQRWVSLTLYERVLTIR